MKKVLAIALIIFIGFMSYVFIGGFIEKQQSEQKSKTDSTPQSVTTQQIEPNSTAKEMQSVYTANEVATHNKRSDCWLIINQNVYDVSRFLAEHPGGASSIMSYCGKEATEAFNTQDRGSRASHSMRATAMLADYLIGKLQ